MLYIHVRSPHRQQECREERKNDRGQHRNQDRPAVQ